MVLCMIYIYMVYLVCYIFVASEYGASRKTAVATLALQFTSFTTSVAR